MLRHRRHDRAHRARSWSLALVATVWRRDGDGETMVCDGVRWRGDRIGLADFVTEATRSPAPVIGAPRPITPTASLVTAPSAKFVGGAVTRDAPSATAFEARRGQRPHLCAGHHYQYHEAPPHPSSPPLRPGVDSVQSLGAGHHDQHAPACTSITSYRHHGGESFFLTIAPGTILVFCPYFPALPVEADCG